MRVFNLLFPSHKSYSFVWLQVCRGRVLWKLGPLPTTRLPSGQHKKQFPRYCDFELGLLVLSFIICLADFSDLQSFRHCVSGVHFYCFLRLACKLSSYFSGFYFKGQRVSNQMYVFMLYKFSVLLWKQSWGSNLNGVLLYWVAILKAASALGYSENIVLA